MSLLKWDIRRARSLTLEGASVRRWGRHRCRGPLDFEGRFRDTYDVPELENVALQTRLFAKTLG